MKSTIVLLVLMAIISCNHQKSSNTINSEVNKSKTSDELSMTKTDSSKTINQSEVNKTPIGFSISNNNCCGRDADSINNWFEYLDSLNATIPEGRYSTHNFLSQISRSKAPLFKTFVSITQDARLKISPKLDEKFSHDTIQMLDSIMVPFFDKKPFKVYIQHEMEVETQTLCCYNGELRYFKDEQFIDKAKSKAICNGNYTLYEGENLIIRNNSTDSIHIIPAHYQTLNSFISWSNDSNMVAYSIFHYSLKSYKEVFLFDLKDWQRKFINYGSIPTFINNQDILFYYHHDKDNSFKYSSINMYNILEEKNKTIFILPDSLDLTGYGPDLFEYSVIKEDIFNDKKCLSVKLWKGQHEEEDLKTYNLYFNFQGDLLGIK